MASIRARGKQKKIYVQFRYSGRQMQEPTPYSCEKMGEKDCKCRACKAAQALAGEIDRKIKEQTFNIAEYFPESKALLNMGFSVVSVDDDVPFPIYAQQWLDFKKPVTTFSTHRGYKSIVRILTSMLNMPVKDIRAAHIRNVIKVFSDDSLSPKTIKNTVLALNNIMQQAKSDNIIKNNPCSNVQLPKVIQQPPDPFNFDEILRILNVIEKINPQLQAFFAIGFYTGMRTGEILALTWGDIDFDKHKIRVSKTCSNGKLKQGTKTNKIHDVDIIEVLDPYLYNHKQYTFLKGESLFLSQRNEPIYSYNPIVNCFQTALKKLGIRYRQPYQMRHSFACNMLAAGEDPNWVKDMLGHTTLEMLFKIYGNWYQPSKDTRAGSKFVSNVAKLLPILEDINVSN